MWRRIHYTSLCCRGSHTTPVPTSQALEAKVAAMDDTFGKLYSEEVLILLPLWQCRSVLHCLHHQTSIDSIVIIQVILQVAGAFVTFNCEASATRCREDYEGSDSYLGETSHSPFRCCDMTCESVMHLPCSCAGQQFQPKPLRFKGKRPLIVTPAPEPTDILWENMCVGLYCLHSELSIVLLRPALVHGAAHHCIYIFRDDEYPVSFVHWQFCGNARASLASCSCVRADGSHPCGGNSRQHRRPCRRGKIFWTFPH